MADTYVAEVYDVGVMYWNPGAISLLEASSLAVDHYNEIGSGFMNDGAAIALPISQQLAMGVGGFVSSMRHSAFDGTGTLRAIMYGFNVDVGANFGSGFGLGGSIAGDQLVSSDRQPWSTSWSLGLLYAPAPDISYGLVYGEMGRKTVVDGQAIMQEKLPRHLEVGITMRYPSARQRQIVSIAFANEKIFGQDGLLYKIGLEVWPLRFLALRSGYIAGPLVGVGRYGLGVRTDLFGLDYAFSPASSYEGFHQFTISIYKD